MSSVATVSVGFNDELLMRMLFHHYAGLLDKDQMQTQRTYVMIAQSMCFLDISKNTDSFISRQVETLQEISTLY